MNFKKIMFFRYLKWLFSKKQKQNLTMKPAEREALVVLIKWQS